MKFFFHLALLVAAHSLFAWGEKGHRIVGDMAEVLISQTTANQIRNILGQESLGEAALWADQIRSNTTYDWAKPMHYISVADNEVFKPNDHTERNVVRAIDYYTGVLKNPMTPKAAQLEALRFLAHFVGDIHQPLHVGRVDDRGGNQTTVSWRGQDTNLHSLWDRFLVEETIAANMNYENYLKTLIKNAQLQSGLIKLLYLDNWAEGSIALRSTVYKTEQFETLFAGWENTYFKKTSPIVTQRLTEAGVRLAQLLDYIFSGKRDIVSLIKGNTIFYQDIGL